MEQLTDSKLGKEYKKAVYYHPAYLIFMQSTSHEILGWMNHKLESRFLGEMSTTSDMEIVISKVYDVSSPIPVTSQQLYW